MNADWRIQQVVSLLVALANNELDTRLVPTGTDSRFDAVIAELNKLADTLQSSPEQKPQMTRLLAETLAEVVTDVTLEQRRAYEAELERSNRELEQFAYVASHDLKEPLRAISNFTQLLADRYEGQLDADADTYIRFAVDGARRMSALLDDLLVFSRVGSGGRAVGPIDPAAVCDQVIDGLRVLIGECGARVTRDPLPPVMSDPAELTQLFQNLISNAIKYRSERPPRVHIGARARPPFVEFSIQDNGIGIAPEHADRVFVLFQRLHRRGEYPGTGIGLAIVKKIVERHGGEVWFSSEPGAGSTFYFTIPGSGL